MFPRPCSSGFYASVPSALNERSNLDNIEGRERKGGDLGTMAEGGNGNGVGWVEGKAVEVYYACIRAPKEKERGKHKAMRERERLRISETPPLTRQSVGS